MVVSPGGPVGPLSPHGETLPAHPGPLDAGEAHTLHSKLPHKTPMGQRAREQRSCSTPEVDEFAQSKIDCAIHNDQLK